jgi:hypothetical protein
LWLPKALTLTLDKLTKWNYFLKSVESVGVLDTGQKTNQLVLTFNSNIKMAYFDFFRRLGWLLSVGVITQLFKLVEKRERKLDKNKLIFLTYILKNSLPITKMSWFSLNRYRISTLTLLKRSGIFKRMEVSSLSIEVSSRVGFKKRVKRIKRRLRKRMFRYEA